MGRGVKSGVRTPQTLVERSKAFCGVFIRRAFTPAVTGRQRHTRSDAITAFYTRGKGLILVEVKVMLWLAPEFFRQVFFVLVLHATLYSGCSIVVQWYTNVMLLVYLRVYWGC